MSGAEDEKTPKEPKITVLPVSFEQSCFDKNWILQLNKQEQFENFICLICKQVANYPIEIDCPQHKSINESPIVGENCLKQFLKVICPLQFQQGGESITCGFKGKIKELNDHLSNVCPLNMSDCWYKPFGCEHSCHKHKLSDHLSLECKFHFDLKEIKQLKLQIQLNEKKNETNATLINENIVSKKEIEQPQQDNEIKKIQRELHKLRADIESMKKETNSNGFIKSLQEKNDTFSFDLFCSSSKLFRTFSGHTSVVWSVDYSIFDDGQYLCSGSHDGTVCVWDVETTKQIRSFKGHTSHVYCAKFAPYYQHYHGINNRRPVICSSSHDKTIRFWDFETCKEFQILNGHTEWVAGIAFSPFNNGKYLCSGSHDKTIRLWDVEASKSLHVFNGHTNCVWHVEFSPLQNNNNSNNENNNAGVIGGNGYFICSGSYDNTIRLWDVETTKELTVFKGHEGCVRSVKYLQYEINTICSGSHDKSIRLWDIRSNKEIYVFKGHTHCVYAIECSPFVRSNNNNTIINSNIICSASHDNTIRFWDIRTNKQLHVIKGNENEEGGISSITFSPLKNKVKASKNTDGRVCSINLCYGSYKGPICIWG
ncbi:WD-40 repeat protein [Reticulomyxa filosa]|uniref:WD-40 repeat protein n=1 Tax=Reticulomyxa filosa TaxID=46433 RepID=X6M8H9_RETFI|nr:WD-40 repeat protein [Reticulomyxa filosa]|eukprot:ETO09926.1 WD-40 repeat protein [Reticulomyxa filosa]